MQSLIKHRIEIGLWLAICVAIASILVMSLSPMDDFNNVHKALYWFTHGYDVYQEDYTTSDPHYLYSPGGTVLLAPIGFITHYATAHRVFSLINALAIIIASALILKKINIVDWKRPAIILALLVTTPVYKSITLGNVNGLLLLGIVGVYLLLDNRKDIPSGIILGLIAVIKPMFAPIIVISLVAFYWKTAASSVLTFITVNVIGYQLVPDSHAYREIVVPYVSVPRPYYNPSLQGLAAEFGWNSALLTTTIIIVTVLFLASVALSYPVWKENKYDWLVIMSTVTLAGVWLLSSLGQGYYSLFLIPIVITFNKMYSPLSSAIGILGFALTFYPLNWGSHTKNMYIATTEWIIFIIGAVIVFAKYNYSKVLESEKTAPVESEAVVNN